MCGADRDYSWIQIEDLEDEEEDELIDVTEEFEVLVPVEVTVSQ